MSLAIKTYPETQENLLQLEGFIREAYLRTAPKRFAKLLRKCEKLKMLRKLNGFHLSKNVVI